VEANAIPAFTLNTAVFRNGRVLLFYFADTSVVTKRLVRTAIILLLRGIFNLLQPTGHVMHQQFNIQQLYVLPTLYLCVLYLSENKQRLVPLTA
jgi:hypothetical protein